jgi:hypothetical protein
MRWPSGENATDRINPVCPVKGPAAVFPVMAFHTRNVPSYEPETMCWQSGENATDQTELHQEKPLFLTCNLLEPVDVTIILLSKAAKAANDA